MDYYLKRAGAAALESKITVTAGHITLHSRSGRARTDPPGFRGRNPDYVPAFDVIFDRLNVPSPAIIRVLLDSTRAQAAPEQERVLASAEDFEAGVLHEVKNQIRRRMRAFGRSEGMPVNEGNQNKKIVIETSLGDAEIVRRLRLLPLPRAVGDSPLAASKLSPDQQPAIALPASELRKVQPQHIRLALQRIDDGDPAASFDPSRDYDVMTGNGRKYAPKKVFGLALEEALGIEAKPAHFNAGWGTPCFDILEDYGLWIAPRQGSAGRPKPSAAKIAAANEQIVPTDEERTWIEGNPKIAVHLKKERYPGLSARKRAQFILEHGTLKCERCDLDPAKAYGEDAGQACIEVHHHRTHVEDMQPGHATNLEDLKCLCSNCHRVLHRALSLGLPFDV